MFPPWALWATVTPRTLTTPLPQQPLQEQRAHKKGGGGRGGGQAHMNTSVRESRVRQG